MKSVQLVLVSVLAAATLGCTKGSPDFQSLGADDIPQPMFAGLTEETLITGSTSQTFAITGDCDSKIRDIAGIAVGTSTAFSSLASMSTGAVTVNCSTTGHFSFTLKSLADLGYSAVSGRSYDIQLRAITSGGTSNPSTIHLKFDSSGGADPKRILLTSGATMSGTGPRLATGAAFNAEIRVTNKVLNYTDATIQDAMTLKTKTGSAFQMRSGLASQSN